MALVLAPSSDFPATQTPGMLRQAAALLLQTAEASERELEVARVAAASAARRAAALEAELAAAAEARAAREAELEDQLAPLRQTCEQLSDEVARLRAALALLATGREAVAPAVAVGKSGRSDEGQARAACLDPERLVAENAKLRTSVQQLAELSRRQAEKISEHEKLLRVCASQAKSNMDRRQAVAAAACLKRRLRAGLVGGDGDGALCGAAFGGEGLQALPPSAGEGSACASASSAGTDVEVIVDEDDGDAGGGDGVAGPACAAVVAVAGAMPPPPVPQARRGLFDADDEREASPPRRSPGSQEGAGPPSAARPGRERPRPAGRAGGAKRPLLLTAAPAVPGLRLFRRRRICDESQVPLPPAAAAAGAAVAPPAKSAFDTSCDEFEAEQARQQAARYGTSEGGAIVAVSKTDGLVAPATVARAVRAEGRAAAAKELPSSGGVPCRCVVRNRGARQALQAYDCEQCRSFHEATGVALAVRPAGGAKAGWQAGPSASRHRFEFAPTNTPPGYWDLSFPRR